MNFTHLRVIIIFFAFRIVASAEWKPTESPLSTSWGRAVELSSVWKEYPRPQLVRQKWTNLNGLWDYAITPKGIEAPAAWDGKILVPFSPEAPLSGVGKTVSPQQTLWYRNKISIKAPAATKTLLHFGAVDYEGFFFLNGKEIGAHKGGHTAFSFDITSALKSGENELIIRIVDDTEGTQLNGKQTLSPGGIWYGGVTGIWQTVWYEHVPLRSIESLQLSSDVKEGRLDVSVGLAGPAVAGEKVRLTARYKGTVQGQTDGIGKLSISFKAPKLWSPDEPNLYDLDLDLVDGKGKVIDSVKSYSAFRQITKERDSAGNLRICINGTPTFLFGPLDQGWWPDGLLTPPSDAAMVAELEFIKSVGFNMLRKHVKVEPARYYYHCDRLGIAVWQDQVSATYNEKSADGHKPKWNFLRPDPIDGTWPAEAHQQWIVEYKRMVDFLRNNPSVVIWSTFNEAWGQHQSMDIGKMAVDYDKTRLVCLASGGNFYPVGDIASAHGYPDPRFPLKDERFTDYVKAVGEMGGHGWAVPGHTWPTEKAWGYGGLTSSLEELKTRYRNSIDKLKRLQRDGIAAAVYTQTYDIKYELNGLMTYDRIPKIDPAWLMEINRKVIHPELPATEPATPEKKVSPAPNRN